MLILGRITTPSSQQNNFLFKPRILKHKNQLADSQIINKEIINNQKKRYKIPILNNQNFYFQSQNFIFKECYSLEQWSLLVKRNYNYKCLLTNKHNTGLDSHHLYSKKNILILSLHPLNGIAINSNLHQIFHRVYGYYITINDFISFLNFLFLNNQTNVSGFNPNHLNYLKIYLLNLKPILDSFLTTKNYQE